MGIKVVEVSKVTDNLDTISDEVKKFSSKYDYVLTTGGIGPTHDDITFEAVANAFGDELHYHPDLSESVFSYFKTNDKNHPALKMANIPKSATLTYGIDAATNKKSFYPVISVKNVFMFPGVPCLCEKLFVDAKDQLFKSVGKFFVKDLYLTQNESLVVSELNDAVKKYPDVLFGSYPKFFHSYYVVKITLESINEITIDEAFQYLKQLIPKQYQIDYDTNPFSRKMEKIRKINDPKLKDILNFLDKLFQMYSPKDIFLYFDGGKNSTFLMYIFTALFEKLFPGISPNAIYIETNPKVNQFIMESTKNYNMNLLKLSKENFENFTRSSTKLCIVKGTRSSDPNFEEITKSLEGLNIVNPLNDWSYGDVWKMIRSLYLPYCPLYDQGYTSISNINSSPNPHLITPGPRADMIYYKKAFELENDKLENAR